MATMTLTAAEAAMVRDLRNQAARAARSRINDAERTLEQRGRLRITRRPGRYHATWGVYADNELICVCLYRRGARNLCNFINNNANKE